MRGKLWTVESNLRKGQLSIEPPRTYADTMTGQANGPSATTRLMVTTQRVTESPKHCRTHLEHAPPRSSHVLHGRTCPWTCQGGRAHRVAARTRLTPSTRAISESAYVHPVDWDCRRVSLDRDRGRATQTRTPPGARGQRPWPCTMRHKAKATTHIAQAPHARTLSSLELSTLTHSPPAAARGG